MQPSGSRGAWCSYPAVLVEYFDDDGGRRGADAGERAGDDDRVEDEHLVPGGTEMSISSQVGLSVSSITCVHWL